MRFIGVLILVVGCGRNGTSADERKKGAAREEDKLRRAGMAASVTTRGGNAETLVLKNLVFRGSDACSDELVKEMASGKSSNPDDLDPTDLVKLGFKRLECESGSAVHGVDLPYTPVAPTPVEQRRKEAERATKQLRGKTSAHIGYVATRGTDDTVIALEGLMMPECSQDLIRSLVDPTWTLPSGLGQNLTAAVFPRTIREFGPEDIARWLKLGFVRLECVSGAEVYGTDLKTARSTPMTAREHRRRWAAEGIYVAGVMGVSATTRGSEDEILVMITEGRCVESALEGGALGYTTPMNDAESNPTPAASLGFVTVVCERVGEKTPRLTKPVAAVTRTAGWRENQARLHDLHEQMLHP
jgi:hypothetical protein